MTGDEDPFAEHRRLLFTAAYEILGTAADAEDVVQETWIRWSGVDAAEVRDPRAYLVRIVTRQALNRLRSVSRRREEYFGEWLPEPLLTDSDIAEDAELAESVSIAMLTVLETLRPAERVVFVLREVFDTPYDEIAQAVDRTPAAVRQIARRARTHVAERRPRMQVNQAEQNAIVEKFMTAVSAGDLSELVKMLDPDVVFVADGGGIVPAARRAVWGIEKVMRFLAHAGEHPDFETHPILINGMSGLRIAVGDAQAVASLTVDNNRITAIYLIGNPNKLTRMESITHLQR